VCRGVAAYLWFTVNGQFWPHGVTCYCVLLYPAGAGSSAHNESETIAKYEIMDGAPVRGENIPIRYVTPQDRQHG
jgi:hypothetical protein